jgi:hypothetical protein
MESNKKSPRNHVTDEIDVIALGKTLWLNKKTIVFVTSCCVVLGVLVAILLKNEFTAGSTFVPQTSEPTKMSGGLGGLASLAGINLGGLGAGSEIPPTLYPKIVSSVPFRKALLEAKINPEGVLEPITYAEFYENIYKPGVVSGFIKYTFGLPGLIIKSLKGTSQSQMKPSNFGITGISESEFTHFKRLENQVSIQFFEKEGFVSIGFVMPEPVMAAQMAKYAEELLQKEVIEYKIQNAREQLKYTESRFEEKKEEFEIIQNKLASFRDRNQNLSSALVLNQLEKLESEYNFAFNIYTELAKQLEQAKLQVSQDTPIFSVIQPVTVPLEKSAPKRSLIVIVFSLLGFLSAIGFVFGKENFLLIKDKWNKS